MLAMPQVVETFPSVRLPSQSGGLPVEVALIAQLGIGAGDALIEAVRTRQAAHPEFVDALDEPSARLGAMDLERGDPSTLYSFAVGASGHPFHRHAGHRVFTAVSGSDGALLRFSTVADGAMTDDPDAFIRALRQVRIPPDSLFTVRFGGGTWHQFAPLRAGSASPALFALSCHTNELGGALPPALREQVVANDADIPSLTEVLPHRVLERLQRHSTTSLPTVALALNAAPESWVANACARIRQTAGPIRRAVAQRRTARGYRADPLRPVDSLSRVPPSMSLQDDLTCADHEDAVTTMLTSSEVGARDATALLRDLLRAFVDRAPASVGRLMSLRNVLVSPLRLRTSPLGCPVSPLLGEAPDRFAGFPVRTHHRAPDGTVTVLLGAEDRHLRFRTRIAVTPLPDGGARLVMATRVQCTNAFGRFYMAAIDSTHRRYVAPTMLRAAANAMAAG